MANIISMEQTLINNNYLKNINKIKSQCKSYHYQLEMTDMEFFELHKTISDFLIKIDPACYEETMDNYVQYCINTLHEEKNQIITLKYLISKILIISAYLKRINIIVEDKKIEELIDMVDIDDTNEMGEIVNIANFRRR